MDNQTVIAKNTLFLYIRMILVTLIALFTSRVVLRVLGVDDFGVYQAVCGVVSLLAFMNTALSGGSSRFITVSLGLNDFEKLKKTFSSILVIHFILGLIVVVVAETFGLWFVFNKLSIPLNRLDSSIVAYHFSVIMIFFSIVQVPYCASILAHEKMNVFAYAGVVEVVLKLLMVYMLQIGSVDRLKLYAMLLCFVQIGMILFYKGYCARKFPETKCRFVFDRNVVKSVLGYTGWNLLTNVTSAFVLHGFTILTNMFFNSGVVAARVIANQVSSAANQLVVNFQQAANPQILKKFAMGDIYGSKNLLIVATQVSFYLMLLLCLPIYLCAETLLKLWLGFAPEYSVAFLKLAIATSLFMVFSQSFYIALQAKGRIKENAIYISSFHLLLIASVYVLFSIGCSPVSLAWGILFEEAFFGLFLKPLIVVKVVGYGWRDFGNVFWPCLKVSLCAIPIPLVLFNVFESIGCNEYAVFAVIVLLSVLSVCVSVWLWGLNAELKAFIRFKIKSIIKR